MLLRFNLGEPLELESVGYIGDGFVIGKHPDLSTDCLFLRSRRLLGTPPVDSALHRLGLEAGTEQGIIGGVVYVNVRSDGDGNNAKTRGATENLYLRRRPAGRVQNNLPRIVVSGPTTKDDEQRFQRAEKVQTRAYEEG